MGTALPPLGLGTWQVTSQESLRGGTRLTVRGGAGAEAAVVVERCTTGRLRDAYPVSEHDLEVRVDSALACCDDLAGLLAELVTAVLAADPACRRVVHASPEGDLERLAAVEEAGFRYVRDVDLAAGPVSLTVAEPDWVTHVDTDPDHVPQS